MLVALRSTEQLLHRAACAALLALSCCTPAIDSMLASGVQHKVQNLISQPDVGVDTRRMGKELVSRLKTEAMPLSSPTMATSPTRGGRLAKGYSTSLALEDSPSPGPKHARKSLSLDDLSASASSPVSSPSKSLHKPSTRRSISDNDYSWTFGRSRLPDSPSKSSQIQLRLPKVGNNGRGDAAVEAGAYGLTASMHSAGLRAREIFSRAGGRLASFSSNFPLVGSVLS